MVRNDLFQGGMRDPRFCRQRERFRFNVRKEEVNERESGETRGDSKRDESESPCWKKQKKHKLKDRSKHFQNRGSEFQISRFASSASFLASQYQCTIFHLVTSGTRQINLDVQALQDWPHVQFKNRYDTRTCTYKNPWPHPLSPYWYIPFRRPPCIRALTRSNQDPRSQLHFIT